MLTKVTLAVLLFVTVIVSVIQNQTITAQRFLILEMTQPPACMVAPLPPQPPKRTFDGDTTTIEVPTSKDLMDPHTQWVI